MAKPVPSALHRHFGLLQATALNVTMIVGAGVFITIPLMRRELPGPYMLLGWAVGAVLMLLDGLVWAELGAALPGSGGSYVYLLECYGRDKWGRAAAFLFIWQFLISGPLELASGLIAIATFAPSFHPRFAAYNEAHALSWTWELSSEWKFSAGIGPAKLIALGLGILIIFLLYRRINALGRLTVAIWVGVLAAIAWILAEGGIHFDVNRFVDTHGQALPPPLPLAKKVGAVTLLAMYSYLGYYNICYIGDEVKEPSRTIPRSILLSALVVAVLLIATHVALLGVVPWETIPTTDKELESYSLPAQFVKTAYGPDRATVPMALMTLLLIWSCFGSAFCGMLGYARIPYGAAKQGHFFSALARIHPVLHIPHVSLLAVGILTLAWSFFDLGSVINAMLVTRILEQFAAQCVGVMVLRERRPDLPRPYRMWLYPLPSVLALIGWLSLYVTADPIFILLGVVTLAAGIAAFLVWSWRGSLWPFQRK
jgi:amino acid transporter